MASALCLVLGIEAKMNQGIVPLARLHDDVAAASAISTGGAAAGNKFFPSEGHAAIAAVPCLHPNSCFIDEHSAFIQCSLFDSSPSTNDGPHISLVFREMWDTTNLDVFSQQL